MIQTIRAHRKLVILSLLILTVIANFAQGNRKRARRYVYVRGANKVYALLAPTGMEKSLAQMQTEANTGRARFTHLYDKGPDPDKDLLQFTTPVKDQGHRGTCVAFASLALMETQIKAASGRNVNLSEQYAYWASKALEKVNPNGDGSEPIGMLQAMSRHGTPTANFWPYDENPWFADKVHHKDCYTAFKANPEDVPTDCVTNGEPPAKAADAPKVTVNHPGNVETSPESIVGYLENNIPVEIAVDVYRHAWHFDQPDSEPFKAGVVDMPVAGDRPIGGHAILVVGYNVKGKYYVFKNSWGTDEWGSRSPIKPGFGVIPMDYVRKFGEATVAKVNN